MKEQHEMENTIMKLFDHFSAARIFEAMGQFAEKKRDDALEPSRADFWQRVSRDMYRLERLADKI